MQSDSDEACCRGNLNYGVLVIRSQLCLIASHPSSASLLHPLLTVHRKGINAPSVHADFSNIAHTMKTSFRIYCWLHHV